MDKFKTDHVIVLTHKVSKKAMRVTDMDEIDCKGTHCLIAKSFPDRNHKTSEKLIYFRPPEYLE